MDLSIRIIIEQIGLQDSAYCIEGITISNIVGLVSFRKDPLKYVDEHSIRENLADSVDCFYFK